MTLGKAVRTPSRRRRRRDTPTVREVLLRAGIAAALSIGLIVLATQLFNGQPWKDYRIIYASVPNTGNLVKHDQVRIGGVRVGQILATEIGSDARPRIKLQLDGGTELPADTKVALRANGLLGGRYVQLLPGRSSEQLREGAVIRGGEHTLTYGLPEALDTFDPQARKDLGSLVREGGRGLLDNGRRINDGLAAADGEVATFGAILRRLNADRGATQRLVPGLDAAVTPLARSRGRLAGLIRETSRGLEPFIREQGSMRATLDRAPRTLRTARQGAAAGRVLLSEVTRLADAASTTLPPAPAGLTATATALRRAPSALRRGERLVDALPSAIPAVYRITAALRPVLPRLDASLEDLHPALSELGRYSCDIKNMAVVFRSMTGFGGAVGSGPAGPPMEFRMQLASPIGPEVIGGKAVAGLKRIGYGAPCTYLAKPYPLTGRPAASRAGG